MPTRCCAKCRTPYNCGYKDCRCHAADTDPDAEVIGLFDYLESKG